MNRLTKLMAVIVVLILSCQTTHLSAASFQGLGDLPGGIFQSRARAVSADGSVVVGEGNTDTGKEAFIWTQEDGMVGLGHLAGFTFESVAAGVSADGNVVVGWSNYDPSNGVPIRWTSGGGMVALDNGIASARDASADGTLITGIIRNEPINQSFLWTQGTGLVALDGFPVGDGRSVGLAISNNGFTIAGTAIAAIKAEPFRWTLTGGMEGLGELPGADRGEAKGVSGDGLVVVGLSALQAFRWTEADGMVGLGDLPGGDFNSAAYGVSYDGSVIVGKGVSADGYHDAMIWTEETGMQRLQDVLINQFGLGAELAGWRLGTDTIFPTSEGLQGAMDISDDGTTIVGWGINPQGNPEAFVAVIPEPSTFVLAFIGIVALIHRGRVKRR